MYLLVFVFLFWMPIAAILEEVVKSRGGVFSNPFKKLLYWIVVLPALWINFIRARTYAGTVGKWFAKLANWLLQ